MTEIALTMATSGLCTSFSISMTNYLDTLRIRWQALPQEMRSQSSLLSYSKHVVRTQGFISGLWLPGCFAHASAGILSASVRIGCYPYFRDLIVSREDKSPVHMLAAGFLSGAIGFSLSNPLFKVKVRQQTSLNVVNNMSFAASKERPKIESTFRILSSIISKDGVQNLFSGTTVLMARGALLNAGQQLGYDYSKTMLLRNGITDGPKVHFTSSICSAFLAVTFCTPADFILTQFNRRRGEFRSVGDCIVRVYKENGMRVFYTGWVALFIRLGPLFVINMPLYEQVRRLVGLSYLN
eukprot:maker-scaffold_53-snap-gene-1.5-mRNA-1 protein AED:0.17 eAED:0.20 QI:0/0/0/1/1/1/3/0/295